MPALFSAQRKVFFQKFSKNVFVYVLIRIIINPSDFYWHIYSKDWMLKLENSYNNYISLGYFCEVAQDLEKLGSLIRTYMLNGGKHIQFNVVDNETLKKAQEKPQDYRDLVVRVAGYSTYFTLLTPAVQNELIARTENKL